jgi:Ca2+-binding EF-hand superfamily protein
MDARVKPAHDEPVSLRRGKILPRRHQLPGAKRATAARNRWFTGFFGMARGLLTNLRVGCGRACAAFVGVQVMLPALGVLSSALDALQSLTAKKSSSPQATTGFSQTATTPFDTGAAASPASGAGGCPPGGGLSPATMSALLAVQDQSSSSTAPTSRSDALQDLFSQLDADGDGKVSKSEFENALGAGGSNIAQADDVFDKLDKNGDGSVSLDEMSSALKGAGGHGHRHKHHVAGSDGSNSDPLLQALDGASSTSTTNSDGSTTTSLNYADGSTVTMTSAPTASASTSAASSYNLIQQMIQREAQAISASVTSSLSVNV